MYKTMKAVPFKSVKKSNSLMIYLSCHKRVKLVFLDQLKRTVNHCWYVISKQWGFSYSRSGRRI